jgi:hypothetical protein
MIGRAWVNLATALEEELRENDPEASVEPWIDATGLLKLDVEISPDRRALAVAKARAFEEKAAAMCEVCGCELQHTRSGPGMAIFLCQTCASS